MAIVWVLLAVFVGVCIGITLGRGQLVYVLTLAPDHNGVTGPHCLNGKFYYLVGESFHIQGKLNFRGSQLMDEDGVNQ